MKKYSVQYGVGSTKYLVNFHDGKSTHKDGSPFFDIRIFKNKPSLSAFVAALRASGFVSE